MGVHEHLGAVFPDRASAEEAVMKLRHLGLADEHLGVAVHEVEDHVFDEDTGHEVARGIGRGVAIGALVGAVAGMILFTLLVPGATALGMGGVLVGGALAGALAGGFWGAYIGLTVEEPLLGEEGDWERLGLEPGEVLTVVAGHEDPSEVRRVLAAHGGRLVEKPVHH
jgi:uncharacterized membrane protein